SYLTFEYFFLSPVHSFDIARPEAAVGLLIALASAYVVRAVARRAQARAGDSRARAREAEEARASQRMLADEQAALRRVATPVAPRGPPGGAFQAAPRGGR